MYVDKLLAENVEQKVKEPRPVCIRHIISRNSERMTQPLGSTLHVKKSNKLSHMDFLYMGRADERYLNYRLLLKQALSFYTLSCPSGSAERNDAMGTTSK